MNQTRFDIIRSTHPSNRRGGQAMVPLDSLSPGESAIVCRFDENGVDSDYLMELGLLVRTPVKMVKCAPFGDPIEICFRDYYLSLRRSEARAILVEKIQDFKEAGY